MVSFVHSVYINSLPDEKLEQFGIVQKLKLFGIPSTGDLSTDKLLLKNAIREQTEHITEKKSAETELYAASAEYDRSTTAAEQEKSILELKGAGMLGELMKIKHGLS